MAIVYNKIARKDPHSKEVKYYPTIKLMGKKKEKDLVERLTRNTTLSRNEAWMVLGELRQAVLDFLMDSYSVEFSDWASFRPTITAAGADTKETCNANFIKKVMCRVTVDKDFDYELQKSTFVDAGDLHTTDPED